LKQIVKTDSIKITGKPLPQRVIRKFTPGPQVPCILNYRPSITKAAYPSSARMSLFYNAGLPGGNSFAASKKKQP
jgi:hypothetical protein